MDPFNSLSLENHDQIRKYLRFFRQKKDGILRSLQREVNDIKGDRLNEDMYTKEDVQEFADFLMSAIRSNLSGDLASIINMGALAVNQLLESSQLKGVELSLETSALENQALVDAVEKMNLDAAPRARRTTGLTSFKDEAKAMRDESSRLEEANSKLQSEVAALRRRLAQLDSSYAAAESKAHSDSRELERALEQAKEESSKRVSETAQFQQMRKMMQSQAAKIRDLRRRLQHYEPDAVKEDDDNY
eukprot:gene36848-44698_t